MMEYPRTQKTFEEAFDMYTPTGGEDWMPTIEYITDEMQNMELEIQSLKEALRSRITGTCVFCDPHFGIHGEHYCLCKHYRAEEMVQQGLKQ